jgi:hypothetical protein
MRPRPSAPPPRPADPPWRPWHNEDLAWAAGAHLGGIVLWIVAPLAVYCLKPHVSGFLRDQAAEALNFQLTLTAAVIGGTLLLGVGAHVLSPVVTLVLLVGSFLALLLLMIYVLVQAIRAALAAGRGEVFRYPATIRLVK